MNPHEIIVDILLESATPTSMPSEEDEVALASWIFLDISDFTLTEAVVKGISDRTKLSAPKAHISAPQFHASLM